MLDSGNIEPLPCGNPFFDPAGRRSFALTTTVAFAVYLCLLAPEVTLEKSGIYSVGAMYAGVPHPPGFPLWTILGRFFTALPFGSIAWRLGVFSAFTGALTCGLIAVMVSAVGGRLLAAAPGGDQLNAPSRIWLRVICGYAAGMVFGFNGAFWEMVEIVDVWPLSILLLTATTCLVLRWLGMPRQKRFLYAACLVYGLTVCNSQALLIMSPVLLSLPLMETSTRKRGPLAICLGLFLLGLTPYLFLPIASMTTPPANWGYPRTLEGFVHTLTRGQYDRIHPTDNWPAYLRQLGMYLSVTVKEFGGIFIPLALLPFSRLHKLPRCERRWLLVLFAIHACLGPLMVAALNPGLDPSSRELNKTFFSASYVILAVEVGCGMIWLGALVTRPSQSGKESGMRLAVSRA